MAATDALLDRLTLRVKGGERDAIALGEDLADAVTLVDAHIAGAAVPDAVRDLAVVTVAADLWTARKAPSGIANQQFGAGDGIAASPLRISRDPLAGVYRLLGKWVTGL